MLLLLAATLQPSVSWSGVAAPVLRIARPAAVRGASTIWPAALLPAPLTQHQWINTVPRCKVNLLESKGAVETATEGALTVDAATRGALQQTAICVAAACTFCAGVFASRGADDASAWFAAYVLEESLSIDNLFVFSLIFDYFQTPPFAQPRVLKYGLIVAVVLRLAFICAGLAVV